MIESQSVCADRCPICGGTNACGNLSVDSNPADCWCYKADMIISQTLLEQVPSTQRGKACICQQCVIRQAADTPDN